ncbi:MAG: STAS domain-containing protein [Treponema sp.]|jgi:anti-sigma B factor antagonist|nr:STAS domain-containing protein [Treponema sp.]
MTIDEHRVAKSVVALNLSGRLDTANAPLLERKIKQWGEDISELILDFSELEYISSMGLRVLLQAQKTMKEQKRRLVIKNMGDSVREVFEMTGFLNLMLQEEKFVVIRKDDPEGIVLSFNGEMKIENIPAVSKELSDIKSQKSRNQITEENIASRDLSKLLEEGSDSNEPVTVILDMEHLNCLSPVACKHLKQALIDTAWKKRTLKIRNASHDVQVVLDSEEMQELLAK